MRVAHHALSSLNHCHNVRIPTPPPTDTPDRAKHHTISTAVCLACIKESLLAVLVELKEIEASHGTTRTGGTSNYNRTATSCEASASAPSSSRCAACALGARREYRYRKVNQRGLRRQGEVGLEYGRNSAAHRGAVLEVDYSFFDAVKCKPTSPLFFSLGRG